IPLNPHSSAIDAQYIAHFSDVIRQNLTPVLMNVTPAYHTILVDYLPYRISEQQLITQLSSLLTQALPLFSNTTDTTNIIELPAYYASET
ncbi:carboxyltransferase domain-containing protein, partial [Streptococcus suis]